MRAGVSHHVCSDLFSISLIKTTLGTDFLSPLHLCYCSTCLETGQHGCFDGLIGSLANFPGASSVVRQNYRPREPWQPHQAKPLLSLRQVCAAEP